MFYYRHVLGASADSLEALDHPTKPTRGARYPSDARALGILLHDYLCEYMSDGGRDGQPIAAGLDEFVGRYGFNETQHRRMVKRASGRLNEFAKSPLADFSCVKKTEHPVRARINRLVFRAILDRVDFADGRHQIIDYKLETERDEYVFQVQFYAWLLQNLEGMAVSEAGLCYLQEPTRIVSVDVSTGALAAVDQSARALDEAITAGRFDASEDAPCDVCRLKHV